MNPFEEFLRRLFGGGPPPTVMEEERQAANMGRVAQTMPEMARSLGRSALEAYRDRNMELMNLARQQAIPGMNVPLSDMPSAPQGTAQRDLALDVLSAGLGTGMNVGTDLLSSAPAIGGSVARNAALDRLRQLPFLSDAAPADFAPDSWKQFGATIPEARTNLSNILGQAPLNPEIVNASQQIPVGHSSPHFYTAPEITRRTASTGEGAALMGPGLYVAEAAPVFEGHYRKTLARSTGPESILGGQLPINRYDLGQQLGAVERKIKGAIKLDPRADVTELERKAGILKDLIRSRLPMRSDIEGGQRQITSGRGLVETALDRISDTERRLARVKAIAGKDGERVWFDSQSQMMQDYYTRRPEELEKTFDLIKTQAKKDIESYTELLRDDIKDYRKRLREFNNRQDRFSKYFNVQQPEQVIATYKGLFGAAPNELLQLDLPFFGLQGNDLERAMQAFGGFSSPGGGNLASTYMQNMEQAARNLPRLSPMTLADWQSDAAKSIRQPLRQAAEDIQKINVNAIKGYGPDYRFTSLTNDPYAIVDRLRDQGIVGTKYADGISRRNFLAPVIDPEETTFNYTVFDPRRIQFTEAYGAANPFSPLGTAMQALQNEKEKKKNAKGARRD